MSGRLSVPEEEWIHLFGGPVPEVKVDTSPKEDSGESKVPEGEPEQTDPTQPARPPSPEGSVRGLLKSGLDSILPSAKKEEEVETVSMKAKRKECKCHFSGRYTFILTV